MEYLDLEAEALRGLSAISGKLDNLSELPAGYVLFYPEGLINTIKHIVENELNYRNPYPKGDDSILLKRAVRNYSPTMDELKLINPDLNNLYKIEQYGLFHLLKRVYFYDHENDSWTKPFDKYSVDELKRYAIRYIYIKVFWDRNSIQEYNFSEADRYWAKYIFMLLEEFSQDGDK